MNAEELIRDSLQELGVQAAEQPITSSHIQTGIRYINRLMSGVDYLGLGFTEISSASDEINIPPYAEEWLVFKLAIRMAPQFPPTDQLQMIIMNERDAWTNLLSQHQDLPAARIGSTVPVGAGNYDSVWGSNFYPGDENCMLDESGNYILVESNN